MDGIQGHSHPETSIENGTPPGLKLEGQCPSVEIIVESLRRGGITCARSKNGGYPDYARRKYGIPMDIRGFPPFNQYLENTSCLT